MLWGNTAYCVKLSGKDVSRYWKKIESFGLISYLESSFTFKYSFAANKAKLYKAINCIFGKIGRIASAKVIFALMKANTCRSYFIGLKIVNSAMRHFLQFAVNTAPCRIFDALSKDTYKDTCKYFGI